MPKSAERGGRSPEEIPKRRPPARDPARRSQQLSQLAQDLLEERVRKGTASPTETVALLKLHDPIAVANLRRVEAQTAYLEAQAEKARSETVREENLKKAMDAMRRYSPTED